jgi:hypothetical protein
VRQGSEAQGTVRDPWSKAGSGEELAATVLAPFQRAGGKFANSTGLVPWSDSELDDLYKVWLQVELTAWKLHRARVPLHPSDIARRGSMCAAP